MSSPVVHIEKIEYITHNHVDLAEIKELLQKLLTNQHKIMADLTQLTAAVEAEGTVVQSAITLLQGLKAALDAAGTDPAALAALSASLGTQTQSLSDAVAANTPQP
jgi:uncharacterized protein YfcZ (UPF0381/DUF406 family)